MERKGKALTLSVFERRKRDGEKLVVVTAYDLTSAVIGAAAGVDALLVGDSLGMVVLGHENTLPVTMDDMLHHTRAVVRARPRVPVVVDMPYGSFHESPAQTVANGLRLIKEGGAHAVKVEGGQVRGEMIRALVAAEIPVMGHLGLTPQSVNRLGGYKVQGRLQPAAEQMRRDAALLAEWGCFAIVLECVPASLASIISRELPIPTIGIGAGAGCDGQVLVWHDLLGLFGGLQPKFVKRYAELGAAAHEAISRYAADVRAGRFPGPEHAYDDQPTAGGADDPEGSPSNVSGQAGYLGSLAEVTPRKPDQG